MKYRHIRLLWGLVLHCVELCDICNDPKDTNDDNKESSECHKHNILKVDNKETYPTIVVVKVAKQRGYQK